ncbi:hypothetical protein [Knoellia koreensis]|jgi:RNase P/RNase MRP subunit POP5|uniref:Uncharacterized protein n=1 Tax=Knoellia koreensis TaxID=2730921 RepID=A0A849HQX2_9MICO|nr:hypothetical protein [Knoellia sp. DB2414S]NNM46997.1 hypothetical protein [Knoellia sp. DB2414S]
MGRIRGHYEWDDDDLSPGQKREGGLHQNLYDRDGHLQGSARFIPDDGTDSDPLVVTQNVYITVEQRREDQDEDELAQAVAAVVLHLLGRGLIAAQPHIQQWWRESGRSAVQARRDRLAARVPLWMVRRSRTIDATVADPGRQIANSPHEGRPDMSRAEAQARYLAALAAKAYSDEQIRLVAKAHIIDTDGLEQLQRSIAELPPAQLRGLLEAMALNPSLLSDESLAELASLLARRELQ